MPARKSELHFDLGFIRPNMTRSYPVTELLHVAPEPVPSLGKTVDSKLDAHSCQGSELATR
jgi:hypothetical protein